MSIQVKLSDLRKQFEQGLPTLDSIDALFQFKAKFLGKSGALSEVLKGLKETPPADRPKIGALANELRDFFEKSLLARQEVLESIEISKQLQSEKIHVTFPGNPRH